MDRSRDKEVSDFNMAETAISQIRGIFLLFEGGIYECLIRLTNLKKKRFVSRR